MKTLRSTGLRVILPFLTLSLGVKAATYDIACSDHWKDVLVGNRTTGYSVRTTGGCTVLARLPIETVDIAANPFSTNSHVELMVGTFDTYFYLRDDPAYKPGNTSATFHENDPNTGALLETVNLSWTSNVLTVSAAMNYDALGGESNYGTQGQAGQSEITDQVSFYFNIGNRSSFTDTLDLTGKNTDYEVTDPLGNPQSLEIGSVTSSKLIRSPVLFIDKPTLGTVISGTGSGKVVFAGTVEGISPLASISYYINGDTNNEIPIVPSFSTPVTSYSWSTVIDLTTNSDARPGSNELSVVAYDIYGGSGGRGRDYLWAFTNAVSLNVTGAGRIAGLKNNQILKLGEAYPVTAVPSNGCFLESWTDGAGDILSRRASFSYILTNDDVLTANFVPNPFADAHGTYTGLFYDTNNGVAPDSAGAVSLTVTAGGGFSGNFRIGNNFYPVSGELELSSNYAEGALVAADENRIIRNGLPPLLFLLRVNVDTNMADAGAGSLGGWIETFTDFSEEQNLWDSSFFGQRSFFVSNNTAFGRSNIEIPPVDPTCVAGPGGYSFGSATVGKTGDVRFVLNLADGATPAVSFASAVASDGSAPFYAPLYGGQGVMLGWFNLSITNEGTPWLAWLKLPSTAKYYPAGFYTNPPSFVSRYIPPRPGTNIFGGAQLQLTLQGANLESDVTAGVNFNDVKNTLSVLPDTNKLALTFAPSTGLVTGTFLAPSSKVPASVKAVFIPAQSNALGFFTDTNETGSVTLGIQ